MHSTKLTDISGKNRGGWKKIREIWSIELERNSNNKNYCKT